jgi:hypothetical protein
MAFGSQRYRCMPCPVVVNDGRSVRWGLCLVGDRPSERWRLRLDRGEVQTVTTVRDEAVDSERRCESTRCYSPLYCAVQCASVHGSRDLASVIQCHCMLQSVFMQSINVTSSSSSLHSLSPTYRGRDSVQQI